MFEKVEELKSFPITKRQIEKGFKEEEHPLFEEYSLRSIYRNGNDECQLVTYDSILNKNKGLEYEQNINAGNYYHVDFLAKKLYITKYQTCTCCCVSIETRFHFLLKNKVLTYTFNSSSYNLFWSVDEKCNLNFAKIKFSEKDSTLYLYSLFPDCSIEPNPYEKETSVVKFKDYTKELFIAVKILEDDILIKRFFDKSIPKEYLKNYEEFTEIKL